MTKSMTMLLTAIVLGVGGQLAMKTGVTKSGDLQALMDQSLWRFIATVGSNPLILTGIFLYGISTIFYLLALSRIDLSVAYPMLALGYVGVLLVSLFVLGEKVTLLRWLGTILIILGVILNAGSTKNP